MHSLLMMALSLTPTATTARHFEFPDGVPFKSTEVIWYVPTTDYQSGRGDWHSKFASSAHWQSEFPWVSGGLDNAPSDTKTYKFIRLSGPIQRWTESFHNGRQTVTYWRWRYPAGTVVGEVINVNGRTVEVGTIEFVSNGPPKFRTYRPFE